MKTVKEQLAEMGGRVDEAAVTVNAQPALQFGISPDGKPVVRVRGKPNAK